MFSNKIFQFGKGYVILYITGNSIERFLNICRRREIRIWGIRRRAAGSAVVCMGLGEFHRIREVAYKTKTRIRIRKKCGLPILLHRYKKRYALYAGAVLVLSFLGIMSQFVWSIEITGLTNTSREEVLLAAEAAGLKIGVTKQSLSDGEAIQSIMLNRLPDVAWSWIYLHGTRAEIRVEEKILPPALVDKKTPCDIVARRDGLIKKVTAKNGAVLLEPGEAVLAGDVVIAGTLAQKDSDALRLVHAIGEVEASTWHEKFGEYKLYHEIRKPTGAETTKHTVQLFSKKINLFRKNGIPYAEYDIIENKRELSIGNENYLGIGLESVTYREVEVIREPVSPEAAAEFARQELEEQIAKELLPGAVRVAEDLEYTQIDDETISVTLVMEFVEKIGTERLIGNNQTE